MSIAGRLATVVVAFLVAVALVVAAVAAFLTPGTPGGVVNFTNAQAAGQPVNLTVQTVGSIGTGPHPTWVSYLVKDPQGKWIHDTTWELPAHTLIHMTVYQYDSGSPLRNQEWGQVQGTIGGTATLNGKTYSQYDSYTGNGVGHTFAIPTLGLSVPLIGVSPNATNVCGVAPCHFNLPHNVITFSFMTPSAGNYPWQCFVPCAAGFLNGLGGPMQTLGYMDGFIDVV